MKKRQLTGTITALVTPYRKGTVAFDELAKLVEQQIKGGVDGLVPVGTTGESPTLTHDEHLEVIQATVAAARGRLPVIAGTGSNSTAEAVQLTAEATASGADAVLVVAPYYNKPSQEGVFAYFSAVAESTDKPVILYSIPGRCGIEIAVGTVERLRAKYPHVRYIKEAGGSVDRVDLLKQAMGDDITVLCGDDALTLPFISVGAEGVVSVASNLLPSQVVKLVDHALAGEMAKARAAHRKLYPVFKSLFIEPNPVPVKFAMQKAGLIGSAEVRSPLSPITKPSAVALTSVLAAYHGAKSKK